MSESKRYFTIIEVSEQTGFTPETLVYFLENEWISPEVHSEEKQAMLDQEDLARLMLIRELQKDFGVNDESIPVILHLVDQLNYLRCQLANHIK